MYPTLRRVPFSVFFMAVPFEFCDPLDTESMSLILFLLLHPISPLIIHLDVPDNRPLRTFVSGAEKGKSPTIQGHLEFHGHLEKVQNQHGYLQWLNVEVDCNRKTDCAVFLSGFSYTDETIKGTGFVIRMKIRSWSDRELVAQSEELGTLTVQIGTVTDTLGSDTHLYEMKGFINYREAEQDDMTQREILSGDWIIK
jgi:hypothetical protein